MNYQTFRGSALHHSSSAHTCLQPTYRAGHTTVCKWTLRRSAAGKFKNQHRKNTFAQQLSGGEGLITVCITNEVEMPGHLYQGLVVSCTVLYSSPIPSYRGWDSEVFCLHIFRLPRYLALIEQPLNCLNCRRTLSAKAWRLQLLAGFLFLSVRDPPAGPACSCINDHSLVHCQRAAPIPVPSLPYTCLVSWASRPIFIPPSLVLMVNHVSLAAPEGCDF
ncbi:hypothetical protein BGX38DRAFT_369077 [Terfezia claveryi]|nr:hypothetical protein BGX38DRAFT_369077 [Terfezia claveryi]